MNTVQRLETWTWVLIYIGLLLLGLGLSVQRTAPALGWVMTIAGIVLVALGLLLIYLRSRIRDGAPPPKETP